MDEAIQEKIKSLTDDLVTDISKRAKGQKPEIKKVVPNGVHPFTEEGIEVKKARIKRRTGDGPAYLRAVGISPDGNIDGIRFVATGEGKKAENLGVRPHEARKKRTTWQDGVK